jgi:hypothetical protein
MRITRIRLQFAVVLFILLPASAGVIAVHASATCERFVRTYVTKPVRNRVSKTTADAWAAWRVAHPDWKPNPNLHRPKYVMTRDEQVQKVNFACEVPLEPSNVTIFFQTAQVEPPPVILLPAISTQTTMPTVPTEVAEVVTPLPVVGSFAPPIPVPAASTSAPPPVPEPASLLMVATGLAGLLLRRMTRANAAQSA